MLYSFFEDSHFKKGSNSFEHNFTRTNFASKSFTKLTKGKAKAIIQKVKIDLDETSALLSSAFLAPGRSRQS